MGFNVICAAFKKNPETVCHTIFINDKTFRHTIFIYGKMFITEISYNFLYVWNCMELYQKKFPIYESCMTSIFGQPWLQEIKK